VFRVHYVHPIKSKADFQEFLEKFTNVITTATCRVDFQLEPECERGYSSFREVTPESWYLADYGINQGNSLARSSQYPFTLGMASSESFEDEDVSIYSATLAGKGSQWNLSLDPAALSETPAIASSFVPRDGISISLLRPSKEYFFQKAIDFDPTDPSTTISVPDGMQCTSTIQCALPLPNLHQEKFAQTSCINGICRAQQIGANLPPIDVALMQMVLAQEAYLPFFDNILNPSDGQETDSGSGWSWMFYLFIGLAVGLFVIAAVLLFLWFYKRAARLRDNHKNNPTELAEPLQHPMN
jgi:hypothetical protein